MFELFLSFVQDVRHHHAWNKSDRYGNIDRIVESNRLVSSALEHPEHWERLGVDIEFEVWLVESCLQD
jgi:hypothetical protein